MAIVIPQWYDRPRHVTLKIDSERAKKDPIGGDVVIFLLTGVIEPVLVPLHVVDFGNSTVMAAAVGESGDSVIVTFSPTSSGTSTFSIDRTILETTLLVE